MNIKSWLRKSPAAAMVRCDGQRSVRIGEGGRKWAEAEEAILEICPTKIEALDAQGNVLRVCTLDLEKNEIAEKNSKTEESKDAFADLVEKVGGIYQQAYGQAYNHSSATIAHLKEMNATLSAQLAGAQTAFLTAINQLAEERMAAAEAESGSMVPALMSTIASGLDTPKPNGKKAEGKT